MQNIRPETSEIRNRKGKIVVHVLPFDAAAAASAYLTQMEGLGYGRAEAAALLEQKAAEETNIQEGRP